MNPLLRAMLQGGLGFGLASLVVFATVAFGEGAMYSHLGKAGAYLTWTALFILLGGGALQPLSAPPLRGARFFAVFALAFFLYAVAWYAAYFRVRGPLGEWLAVLASGFCLGQTLSVAFRVRQAPFRAALLLMLANIAGYFLGSLLNDAFPRPTGMLLWGGIYGVCLGAGLGLVLHLAPRQAAAL